MNPYNGFSGEQRARANTWLNAQYAARAVRRPSACLAGCGQTHGLFHHHAESYAEPFGPHIHMYPICYTCHIMLHCRFRSPLAWKRYLRLLLLGWRFRNPAGNDFGHIKNILSDLEGLFEGCVHTSALESRGPKLEKLSPIFVFPLQPVNLTKVSPEQVTARIEELLRSGANNAA